ncbi:hypothetical protein KI809_18755 [Geobacter pelophilus]|uniref:Uncharacterized protein n=1 Tax=Geoanaerobacter pelophilus TaxID=60036 RepID=A0AAW4L6E4_9BACT|nr:hypothetical protein [Geoanaerobacter pelophilus]MBT0665747.1 hypothetical protein [Geoanaerobacter pelophilus]MBT0666353.1 hypothetical protein [Geoanaerobacter pelophilus]
MNYLPLTAITRVNPTCSTCHGDWGLWAFGNATTALAHGNGNPVTFGE